MLETPWYFRLFFVNILWFVISFILSGMIKSKRMSSPEPRFAMFIYLLVFVAGCVLMWFVRFRINLAFWIGLGIIIFGEVVYALGFCAMREHPEKTQKVVDWGIYRISRHSHILAGLICLLGVIVVGWNPGSVLFIILWIYFAVNVLISHWYVLSEEKVNVKKFGQEYQDYMRKTPRYVGIPKSGKK